MIRRLQALRFFAAAFVLISHSLMELVQHDRPLGMFDAWQYAPWGIGVDIFFVISGFIIATASLDRPATLASVGDYMVHRVIRVWPTYAFFTALMLVATLAVPSFLRHAGLDPAFILASFLFLPWPRPGDGKPYPLLGQGWTLNYEMFFYVSFGLVLLLPARVRVATLCIAGVGLIALGQMASLPLPLSFYAKPVIAEFLFGVVLSRIYARWAAPGWVGAVLIAAAIVYLLAVPIDTEVEWRGLWSGMPAVLIVAGVLFSGAAGERLLGRPWLVLLGNASYALYLSHTFVVNAVLLVMLKLLGTAPPLLFMLAAFVVSTIGSVVAYRLVEQPFLGLLKPRYAALRARRRMVLAGREA